MGRTPGILFRYCDDDHKYVCYFKPIVDAIETEHDFVVNEDTPPLFWPYCSKEHSNGNS